MKQYFFILAFSFALIACGIKSGSEAEQATDAVGMDTITVTDAQIKNAEFQTGPLQTGEMSSLLKVNGKVDVPPQNMVSISVPLGGYLKTSKLLPGMHVNKGEVLAIMEDQQYIQLQQDYLMAKVKLSQLEKEYARQKEGQT